MSRELPHTSRKYQIRKQLKPTIAPLTAAIGTALAAGSLHAATITVDTLASDAVAGQCSLRSALYASTTDSSSAGCPAGDAVQDTIVFDSSLSGTITLQASDGGFYYDGSTLPIGESVIIDGDERITLQGTGAAPVLYQKYDSPAGFTADVVELRGLTITGGGGDRGGAVFSKSRELILRDCTLDDNQAVGRGGAISFEYAGSATARLRLRNSTITGNETTGTGGRGGAIYMSSAFASLRVYASDISYNTSSGSGGGIDFRTETGSLVVRPVGAGTNSSLENNVANYGTGGAINVVSSGGYGVNFTIRGSSVLSNVATDDGGAIAFYDTGTGQNGFGKLSIEGVSFQQNNSGGDGGAVWFRRGDGSGTVADPLNELLISDYAYSGQVTDFTDNVAAYSSGGLYARVGDAVPVTMENTYFTNNIASSGNAGGAAIIAGNSGITMADTEFVFNRAENGGSGGGLLATTANGGDFEASEASFIANVADGSAGGLQIDTDGGDVGLEFAFISGNDALTGYGGGIQFYGAPNQLGLAYSVLTGNTASSNGGAMDLYVPGATNTQLELKYSEVSSNTAGGSGGGLSLSAGSGSQFFFKNSTASGNNSGANGGAIYAYNDITLAMKYSTIADNYAGSEGGGVITNLPEGNCYSANSIFAGNTAGTEAEGQDLRSSNSYYCDVDQSLLAGKYSEFNNGTGNILFQDPLLQPLGDNGGPGTWAHALDPSSPAVDSGSSGDFAPDNDQRGTGFTRVFGAAIDMGAYELQSLEDAIFSDRFEAP